MKYFFDSDEAKARLLRAAAQWMGTPFHAKACVRGAGVDCVNLVAQIYIAVDVLQEFKPPAYVMDGGHHDESSKVIEYVEASKRFEKIWSGPETKGGEKIDPPTHLMRTGDLVCFKIGGVTYHVGIALNSMMFLQVYAKSRVSSYTLQDSTWSWRLTAIYRPLA